MVPGRSLVSASEKMPGYSKNCRIGYGYPGISQEGPSLSRTSFFRNKIKYSIFTIIG